VGSRNEFALLDAETLYRGSCYADGNHQKSSATRLTVAQIYRLLESKLVRKVLFLVDRKALAVQAVREFYAFNTTFLAAKQIAGRADGSTTQPYVWRGPKIWLQLWR
jgi:hypothetical protein